MLLKARVGRHFNTRAQCQNWVDDQLVVINLLNYIPTASGGAEGGIPTNRMVAGIASDALCAAILRFQRQHFPAQQSGFVEPNGPALAKMETLSSQQAAATAAKPTGQWGEFKSGSVQRALYQALKDSGDLPHEKVVDVLMNTLSNGTVSAAELDDLQMVADKSKSISARSRTMLTRFVAEARDHRRKIGPYELTTQAQINASEVVGDFLKRGGNGQWAHLDRDEVGVGLLMRLAYPGLLRQGDASLCGPAAYLFGLLQDRPGLYVGFAIGLYEKGTAHLGGLAISPGKGVREYLPASGDIDPVDWLTMASLRDSENWFFSYDSADKTFSGATTQLEMAWWFDRAGYSDVKNETNLLRHQRDTDNMDEASQLFSAGYRVCLLIDDPMLYTDRQGKSGSMVASDRHWIVLRSIIDRSGGKVKMTVFTWGEGNRQVPQSGDLPLSDFLENYYGYVAGKP